MVLAVWKRGKAPQNRIVAATKKALWETSGARLPRKCMNIIVSGRSAPTVRADGPRGQSARTVRADGSLGLSALTVCADGLRGRSAQTVRANGPRGRSARTIRADGGAISV